MFAPKISNEVLEMTTSGTMFVAKITILFELTMLFGEKGCFFHLVTFKYDYCCKNRVQLCEISA